MIEDVRIEFEERLAASIETMKADIKKLFRRVREDFARYGDYEQCRNYVDVRKSSKT